MTIEETLSLERQGFFVSRYQHLNAELPPAQLSALPWHHLRRGQG